MDLTNRRDRPVPAALVRPWRLEALAGPGDLRRPLGLAARVALVHPEPLGVPQAPAFPQAPPGPWSIPRMRTRRQEQ